MIKSGLILKFEASIFKTRHSFYSTRENKDIFLLENAINRHDM